jgi:hypothetical protein
LWLCYCHIWWFVPPGCWVCGTMFIAGYAWDHLFGTWLLLNNIGWLCGGSGCGCKKFQLWHQMFCISSRWLSKYGSFLVIGIYFGLWWFVLHQFHKWAGARYLKKLLVQYYIGWPLFIIEQNCLISGSRICGIGCGVRKIWILNLALITNG